MPRVNRVDKARKAQGTCGKCGKEIKAGDPYLWWKFRFGAKHKRCMACPPKASDLTQSEFLGQIADFQERDFSDCETIEDLESAKDELISDLESLRDEQEEKRSNMPEGLQEGDVGQLLQERYDALDECINTIEGIDISSEGDEPDEEDYADDVGDPEPEQPEETDEMSEDQKQDAIDSWSNAHHAWEERRKAWMDKKTEEYNEANRERVEEIASELNDALQGISCG